MQIKTKADRAQCWIVDWEGSVLLNVGKTQESFLVDMIRNRFPESSLILSISSHFLLLNFNKSFQLIKQKIYFLSQNIWDVWHLAANSDRIYLTALLSDYNINKHTVHDSAKYPKDRLQLSILIPSALRLEFPLCWMAHMPMQKLS